jgi:hypothetical protein
VNGVDGPFLNFAVEPKLPGREGGTFLQVWGYRGHGDNIPNMAPSAEKDQRMCAIICVATVGGVLFLLRGGILLSLMRN